MHRLGRAYGIIDIDSLDNAISKEQLLEHQAAAWIDGWYHGRTQIAEFAAEIRNLGNTVRIANSSDPKALAEVITWHSSHKIIEQMTTTTPTETKKPTVFSGHELTAELERRYG